MLTMITQEHSNEEYSFAKKWSPAIAAHGHTAIPNLLLRRYLDMGITSPELRMIIALETYRWDDKEPFPSVKSLSKLTGVSSRQGRLILTSLHNKGLIIRTEHVGGTNTYNYDRLIYKLDQLATSSLPLGRKEPPSQEETRLERRMKTSSKEDASQQDTKLKPNINTGLENAWEIAKQRYAK